LNRFDLDDEAFLQKEIKNLFANFLAFEHHWKLFLLRDSQDQTLQPQGHGVLVRLFAESFSKSVVDLKRCSDDFFGEVTEQ
jgi:hypothetical protein